MNFLPIYAIMLKREKHYYSYLRNPLFLLKRENGGLLKIE